MGNLLLRQRLQICTSVLFFLFILSTLITAFMARFTSIPQFRRFSTKPHFSEGDERCKPRNYIFYLKTHKTGSSTLASILYRYGNDRNLTFVLPKKHIDFNWPKRFHLSATIPLYAEEGKILASHTRYNKAPVNLLFPKPKSKYITILRHPSDQFESVFCFFEMARKLGLENNANPIESFLRSNPEDSPESRFQTLRNPSMFDLGFDQEYFENRNAVMRYINYIEEEFDLVLINEYYDESLILLKNLLCWDLDDILYLKHKVRVDRERLSNEVKANILSWSHADLLLYNHFNATLWKKVSEAGPKFFNDLKLFRQKNEILGTVCSRQHENRVSEVDSEKNAETYSHELCNQLTKRIIDVLAYTKKKMEERWNVDDALPGESFKVSKEDWDENHELKYTPV